uniref:Uncharacterized protein n=1 Tax=Triticum urartu TaxID=4572 RepID=A0A8R7V683_TRIUA
RTLPSPRPNKDGDDTGDEEERGRARRGIDRRITNLGGRGGPRAHVDVLVVDGNLLAVHLLHGRRVLSSNLLASANLIPGLISSRWRFSMGSPSTSPSSDPLFISPSPPLLSAADDAADGHLRGQPAPAALPPPRRHRLNPSWEWEDEKKEDAAGRERDGRVRKRRRWAQGT